ncbi:hypothetical protein BCR35DRAFT_266061, partial [Leucosporidium creatinivorum]
TFVNKCKHTIKPVIADVACIYTTCSAAEKKAAAQHSYTGAAVGKIGAGKRKSRTINNKWLGRIFNQDGTCGSLGEHCSMTEFNLDTGSVYTPQAYDISNIQGYTQALQICSPGCDTVTCRSASCSCNQAYPIGDMSGCGNDYPVRACGAGSKAFEIVFCP